MKNLRQDAAVSANQKVQEEIINNELNKLSTMLFILSTALTQIRPKLNITSLPARVSKAVHAKSVSIEAVKIFKRTEKKNYQHHTLRRVENYLRDTFMSVYRKAYDNKFYDLQKSGCSCNEKKRKAFDIFSYDIKNIYVNRYRELHRPDIMNFDVIITELKNDAMNLGIKHAKLDCSVSINGGLEIIGRCGKITKKRK